MSLLNVLFPISLEEDRYWDIIQDSIEIGDKY